MYITKPVRKNIMSSGHASHKGTDTKPNVNAENQRAADPDAEISENLAIEPDAPIPGRTTEGRENSIATERPEPAKS
ncbi:hypothetical protein V0288_04235 [Pannus brasiliensis CCIBt3594]|uniref:Uncharacterized protein n=1 Tax=Pannus brasiliensis CCIBt3594 TaxID=1427578 RepID=A0AAW9QUP0_9CHRO